MRMAPWCSIPWRPRTGAWSGGAGSWRTVAAHCGYRIRRILDLSPFEAQGRYLEGTGSLVLDHGARRAFACRSSRTDESLVRHWAEQLGYEPVVFDAVDAAGVPFYHTNVMLSIGHRVAVVAAEAIVPADRERVLAALASGGTERHRNRPGRRRGVCREHARARRCRGPGRLRPVGARRTHPAGARLGPRWPPAPISCCRSPSRPSSASAGAACGACWLRYSRPA